MAKKTAVVEIGEALEAYIDMQIALHTKIEVNPDDGWFKRQLEKWKKRADKAKSIADFIDEAGDIDIWEFVDTPAPKLLILSRQIHSEFPKLSQPDALSGLIIVQESAKIVKRNPIKK